MANKYLHLFNTTSQYENERSSNYEEPWVSYTVATGEVHYNKAVKINGYDYVDLGLSSGTLWATMNVEARSIGDSGAYLQFGRTTKCNDSNYAENADNYGTLDPVNDVATFYMGEPWITPTQEHVQELIAGTTQEVTSSYMGNLSGCVFTSNTNGNVLFIPACGWYNTAISQTLANEGLYFWTSTLSGGYPCHAVWTGSSISINQTYNTSAIPIRAVIDGNNLII